VDSLLYDLTGVGRGETQIVISKGTLAKHLLERRGNNRDGLKDEEAINELQQTVAAANLTELADALSRLASFLYNFQALHDTMVREGRGSDELSLAALARGITPIALLHPPPAGSQTYYFRYDYDGNELPPPTVEAIATVPDVPNLVAFAREVVEVMNQLGLTFRRSSKRLPWGISCYRVARRSLTMICWAPGTTSPQGFGSAVMLIPRPKPALGASGFTTAAE